MWVPLPRYSATDADEGGSEPRGGSGCLESAVLLALSDLWELRSVESQLWRLQGREIAAATGSAMADREISVGRAYHPAGLARSDITLACIVAEDESEGQRESDGERRSATAQGDGTGTELTCSP